MANSIRTVAGWFLKKLGLLVLIIGMLMLAPSVKQAVQVVSEFAPEGVFNGVASEIVNADLKVTPFGSKTPNEY